MLHLQVRLPLPAPYQNHDLTVDRARRVKCDETRPICIRCQRSGKSCGGYKSSGSRPSPSSEAQPYDMPCSTAVHSTQLVCNPSFGVQSDAGSLRYSRLCLEVLLHDRYKPSSFSGQSTWADLLTQFSSINVAVRTALATFGAVYEAIILRRAQSSRSLASIQYSKALSALQKDVALQEHGPISSFLASVILAVAQVILRNYLNSLTHLNGAFTVLTSTISPQIQNSTKTNNLSSSGGPSRELNTYQVELYSFAQSLDLQTASYVLSGPPELPSSFNSETLNQCWDPNFLERASEVLQPLLHHCYHFANSASYYKYLLRSHFPAELAVEQGKCIAYLSQWLAKCDDELRGWPARWTQSESRQTYLIQRVQCLSALVYVSAISSPYESTYDTYSTFFQQIIRNADEVLGGHAFISVPPSPISGFRIQPGLAQALFLTSLKFRHGSQRRKAIDLLSRLGMEGPWDPDILCKVARRAVEIEESRSFSVPLAEKGRHCWSGSEVSMDGCGNDPSGATIPEQYRLHGCAMGAEADEMDANKMVSVQFSLCIDVEYMVRSGCHESHSHWIIWTESIANGAEPIS